VEAARSSLRWLVEWYYESADYKTLGERTRHVRRQMLDALCLEPVSGSQGFHTCTIEEVRRYEVRHPVGTKARLALALLLVTGQRRSDVLRFGACDDHGKDEAARETATACGELGCPCIEACGRAPRSHAISRKICLSRRSR
jgi:hypothetical protein